MESAWSGAALIISWIQSKVIWDESINELLCRPADMYVHVCVWGGYTRAHISTCKCVHVIIMFTVTEAGRPIHYG